jgi:hypothetical protein
MTDLSSKAVERIQEELEVILAWRVPGPVKRFLVDYVPMLFASIETLQRRLEKNTCNSGHVTLPLILWDCPECHNQTRREREALSIRVQELTDRLLEVTKTLPSAVPHKEEEG